ncbi:MAG: Rne/Rng family ribonuclease [Phycisphaerales bacterium]
MTDDPKNTSSDHAADSTDNQTPDSGSKPAGRSRKKSAAKKTTRKPAAKKTTKKTAKPAAKKTAKKPTKKRASRKKAAAKSAPEEGADTGVDAPEPATPDSTDDLFDEPSPVAAADADFDEDDDDVEVDDRYDDDESDDPRARSSERAQAGDDEDEDQEDEDGDTDGGGRGRRSRSSRTRKKSASSSSDRKPAARSSSRSSGPAEKKVTKSEMIINYVPGEECRIAMLEDGQLEELMVEPTDRVSRVGNIYVGRVANIEASIQAAFIDFGTEENGFLHISDLHPRYFATGDEQTERVGKKTPRRSRPPVQDCLKKGQEIIVQVLKEGVGTKGPTLTSYLSIPGRFLVMMPGMDKVGVSRKEEDDDKRKAAKQILSQLELPDGFGFILRTAGFDRTKAELKRDLAYLARLWKDMETRRKKGKKPRLLYTESDLLVRSIRDLLTSEVQRVVIDSEPALKRVARFIKIAAPRSSTKLSHYTASRPIFHAFGIEPQINAIHAREVELPSGGRLVLDQTEALVAIDVNSGRSRSARDAETNAYNTNLEAVDAICRQLRLRDMGGLVVCDMIDMRHASHRKQIEQRFNERLKRDRAKSTTAPISPFGLLEMTRQRMRGSMESQHFAECPMCHGRGLIKRPDSVAATAIRDLAALLDYDSVHRAELVVNPRVASSLLSTKRASLTRIELICGKTLDVRVSESLPIDRVAFYAYDASGSDVAIDKLRSSRGSDPEPHVVEWRDESDRDGSWAKDPLEEVDETTVQKLAEEIARKAEQAEHVQLPVEGDLDDHDSDGEPRKKRRRRRRGGRGRSEGEQGERGGEDNAESEPRTRRSERDEDEQDDAEQGGRGDEDRSGSDQSETDSDGQPRKKRRRRRRGGRGRSGGGETGGERGEGDESNEPRADRSDERKRDDRGRDRREEREESQESSDSSGSSESSDDDRQDGDGPRKRRRPRRRPSRGQSAESERSQDDSGSERQDAREESGGKDSGPIAEPKPKNRRRPAKPAADRSADKPADKPSAGSGARSDGKPERSGSSKVPESNGKPDTPKPRRGLYSNARRTLSASELAKLGIE